MKKIALMIISLIFIMIAGCGTDYMLSIKLSAPKLFTPGEPYAMQFNIKDLKGNLVKGAKVTANVRMKNMDHGTIPVAIEDIGEGKYIGTADLPMNGDWLMEVIVDHDGETYTEEKQFNIEVQTAENAHKVSKISSLPEFHLLDEDGRQVSKQDLLGKTVVMTFTYVKCIDPNACPILLGNFSHLQEDLKAKGSETNNLLLVSVSLDPENDRPEVLKEHAEKMNFDRSYLKMLTGDLNEIKKLTEMAGINFAKKGLEVVHDNKTIVINKEGKLTHEFTGSIIDRGELIQVVAGE